NTPRQASTSAGGADANSPLFTFNFDSRMQLQTPRRGPLSPLSPSPSAAHRRLAQQQQPRRSPSGTAQVLSSRPNISARRSAFLNRVRQGRDEAHFNARADRLAIADYMQYMEERKREKEMLKRAAPKLEPGYAEREEKEVLKDTMSSESKQMQRQQWGDDTSIIEEELLAQERDLQALVEEMERREAEHGAYSDEEYDEIFENLVSSHAQQTVHAPDSDSHMDRDMYPGMFSDHELNDILGHDLPSQHKQQAQHAADEDTHMSTDATPTTYSDQEYDDIFENLASSHDVGDSNQPDSMDVD
ncbi:hypothetical protein KEM55_001672, partial [Ascosphaera atra]